MNLVIDFGNTATKFAVFSEGRSLVIRREENLSLRQLLAVIDEFPDINRAIVSSVTNYSGELQDYLANVCDFFVVLDHNTPLPISNLYNTPSTLGVDRIADAVGANTIYPDNNVLVIDIGTAITIDLVTKDAKFIGGNISPGISIRARGLHKFTSRLPLVNPIGEHELLGKSTEEAIRAGIMNGITFEIQGYIENLEREYSDLQIILTGGDAKYFDKKLNYSIFVDSNLNLTGLNRILNYNVKQI